MSAPAISVLVPCFNHGQWIDEAIDSVLDQTVADFEIVVVDDGSTDTATVEKLAAYDRPKTRVVRTDNRGLPAARNLAARLSTGGFLCALDADDRLAPTWFERALAQFARDPDLAFVSHWLEAFGDEAWLWQPERCELPDLLARNVVNSAALVRRQAFEEVGGFDETMRFGCEDWDFWLRIVESGMRGAIVPEVHYHYRRREDSMSRQMTASAATYRVPLDQLVRKHAAALRAHAFDVLVSKEIEAARLHREIHLLERDHFVEMQPALARVREQAAAAQAEARHRDSLAPLHSENERLKEERARLQHDRVRLHDDNDRLRHEAAVLRIEVNTLHSAAADLHAENAALRSHAATREHEIRELRASWSWRLMRPLRAVVGFLRGEP